VLNPLTLYELKKGGKGMSLLRQVFQLPAQVRFAEFVLWPLGKQLVTMIGLFFFIQVLLLVAYVTPEIHGLKELEALETKLEVELEQKQERLQKLRVNFMSQQQSKRLSEKRLQGLIEEHERSHLLTKITGIFATSTIELRKIYWGEKEESGTLLRAPLHAELVGSYQAIVLAMGSVAELPSLSIIRELHIEKMLPHSERLRAEMVIDTYHMKGEQEQNE
jgi:Tfp pilus assembly protein PilO